MTNERFEEAKRTIERLGFTVYRGNDNFFVIMHECRDRVVSFGPGVLTRAWEACLELRPELRASEAPAPAIR
jgi:hypothetical protein